MIQLFVQAEQYLPSYAEALRRCWSPNNERGLAASIEELAQIEANPVAFIASLDDREAKGAPVKMPDGSVVPRLPGFRRWMWDGVGCQKLASACSGPPVKVYFLYHDAL